MTPENRRALISMTRRMNQRIKNLVEVDQMNADHGVDTATRLNGLLEALRELHVDVQVLDAYGLDGVALGTEKGVSGALRRLEKINAYHRATRGE